MARSAFAAVLACSLLAGLPSCEGSNGDTPGQAGTAGAPSAGAAASGTGGRSASGGSTGNATTAGVAGTEPASGAGGGGTSGGAGRSASAGRGSAGTANGGASAGRTSSGGGTSGGDESGGRATGGSSNAGEGGEATGMSGAGGSAPNGSTYDAVVLADNPVLYLAMSALDGTEPDLTGHGHDGTYHGGANPSATLPNGDQAADFAGNPHYVSVPSSAGLSIPTTQNLTWEAWIRPAVLQFDDDSSGYVDWMGKCEEYSPTCEWEARMYNMTNSSNRCNRLSAYAFNPTADLGSGAYWEAGTCGTIEAGSWYHVVGQYSTEVTPSGCSNAGEFPGGIEIWVNGVKWNHASHGDTGCMSQYDVKPVANDSALNIATMAKDAWFQGSIAKVAVYGVRLTNEQVAHHYQVMTGKAPTGSCSSTCSF